MNNNYTELKVNINAQKASSYPILVGSGLLKNAENYLKSYTKAKKFLVVTNETINALYPNELEFEGATKLILKDGEEFKNFDTLQTIITKALELKLERKDAIIAFGGGVIGDMAGFAAAIYQRGIDFIQVPTTLLAQVDSSVGGKVAVNHALGKNMIGNFYQPKLVLADIDSLKTLDMRQLKTGLAEVVKYAFIEKTCNSEKDYNFFEFLNENAKSTLNLDKQIIQRTIEICCELKASVVNQDEKEKGLRAILNLGHTFAHAYENLTHYKFYTHGEAVAIGLKKALMLSFNKGLISKDYFENANNLVDKFEFNLEIAPNLSSDDLYKAMNLDKKVDSGRINFVLPSSEREVKVFNDISECEVKEVLQNNGKK